MTTTPKNNNILQYNRVYVPIVIGVALLMMAIVLYPLYTTHMNMQNVGRELEVTQETRQMELNRLQSLQKKFTASGSMNEQEQGMKKMVEKYSKKFDTSTVMDTILINKFTKIPTASSLSISNENTLTDALMSSETASISIADLAVMPASKLPNGLSVANITLSMTAQNYNVAIDYLMYLTEETPFAFSIDKITLPIDTDIPDDELKSLTLSLNLSVHYYQ